LDDLLRERGCHAHVGVAGRGFMAEGYLLLHGCCCGQRRWKRRCSCLTKTVAAQT
jgi:hypothetical protein